MIVYSLTTSDSSFTHYCYINQSLESPVKGNSNYKTNTAARDKKNCYGR